MDSEKEMLSAESVKPWITKNKVNDFILEYDAFLRTLKENANVGHVFLLGAGASISSGIQSAGDCIWEWKRNIFVTQNPNLAQQYREYQTDAVQKSIQRWLDAEGSYPAMNSPEEYTFYAQKAYPIDEVRRKYFENICTGKEPHWGYKILCLLAKYGMVKSVFTTNFDGLVEKAAHQMGLTPIAVGLDSTDRMHRPANNNELLAVSLHGDFKFGPLKNTGTELDNQHDTFVKSLEQHLYDKHLIVIGYSGRDKSLMDALKKAYAKPGAGMLFWCGYGHEVAAEVRDLLTSINQSNRRAFVIPTEGFDTTLNHISKTCFPNNQGFETEVTKILKNSSHDEIVRTPFTMEARQPNTLLKSNLFPISLPTEVFQFQATKNSNDITWDEIRAVCKDRNIVAVPLKKLVYALGVQTELREAFAEYLNGEITRTPVTYREIKDGTVFKNLYLKTVIKALCDTYNLKTDGYQKIYLPDSKTPVVKSDQIYDVYDAIEVSFVFDSKILSEKPFAYLSIRPAFYIVSEGEVTKAIKFEIGKSYHEKLFKFQPNVKFNDQIERWKNLLFPSNNHLKFEYPLNSGTSFKFAISPNTMHVSIARASGGYPLRLPQSFNPKLILHTGIQYSEPNLEFVSRANGGIVQEFHPMRGLIKNRPYDYSLNGNVFEAEINVGVICPDNYKQGLYSFLNRLNSSQSAGGANPDYLIDYPGFNSAYGIPFNVPDVNSDLWKSCEMAMPPQNLMQSAIELANKVKRAIDQLEAVNKKLVIVVFIPTDWNVITDINNEDEKFDLHDYIKAYAAQKQIATQFIQESTFIDPLVCQVNWWLSLSFYVKAQRTPWVLNGLESNTAFVGIGYSVNRHAAKNKVVLGCSHIYNSFGQGLKYKLSRVEDCQFDKQNNPFLSYEDAYKFGTLTRELFFNAMGEIPKRVVVHKRTPFRKDEIKGIVDSLKKTGIQQIDLVEINFEENARFLSVYPKDDQINPSPYPLSRGTCFLLDNSTAILYTHGIVPSVKADNRSYYLGGKNIPIPLKVKKHYGNSNIGTLATEILGMTKMNWNSFDLYSKLPSTIQTSNEIARIGWLLNRFEGKTYDYRNFM